DAVDGGEVFVVAVYPASGRRFLDVGGALRGLHGALIRARMAGEHAVVEARLAALGRGARTLELLTRLEHVEDVADRFRVVAGPDHVLHAEAIGFHFVIAAVTHHPRLRANVRE